MVAAEDENAKRLESSQISQAVSSNSMVVNAGTAPHHANTTLMTQYPNDSSILSSNCSQLERRNSDNSSFASMCTKSPLKSIKYSQSSSSKAPPQTGSEGVSLPRATLYALYMQHCSENQIEEMNAASFGKMIRSIFSGLRTRRLEISLQIHPSSPDISVMNQGERRQRSGIHRHLMEIRDLKNRAFADGIDGAYKAKKKYNFRTQMKAPEIRDFDFECKDELLNFSMEDLTQFYNLYLEHFEASISAINNNQFEYLCAIWNAFWRHPSIDTSKIIEQRLPRSIFNSLCSKKQVLNFIYESDNRFYQKYADFIFPDVFCPFDDIMVMNLKNATVDMQSILNTSTIHLPESVRKIKKKALDNFLTHLKDMSSMSHSIESVRAIFRSKSCLTQAQSDFSMIDFSEKRLRMLVPNSDYENFDDFISEFFLFKDKFQAQANESIVDALLYRAESIIASSTASIPPSQTSLKMLKLREKYVSWSLYASLLLRELTLRGASSFGIFQLVTTLLDDYMLHCIKLIMSQSSGKPMVCAMCEIPAEELNYQSSS